MVSGVTDSLRVTLQKDGKPVNDGNIRLRRIGAVRGARCKAMEAISRNREKPVTNSCCALLMRFLLEKIRA
jgi:hypothetical protein